MPVEYSPVITSTPRTPIASCARWKPPRRRRSRRRPAVVRLRSRPAAHLHRGDEDARAPAMASTAGEQRPARRAQRAQLRPLRAHDVGLRDPPRGCRDGGGDGDGGAHAAAPVGVVVSLAPRGTRRRRAVRLMNASSSEACCGVSSCRTRPCCGGELADRARLARPRTSSTPGSALAIVHAVAAQQLAQRRRVGRADAHRRAARPARRSPRRSCRRSSGRARRRSGARPSAPSRSSGARRRRPCGPRPPGACSSVADPQDALGVEAVGPARRGSASAGSPSSAEAMPSRWPMPSEKLAGALAGDRLRARRARSPRRRGRAGCRASAPAPAGGCRRERPVWIARASSSAPTSCSGASQSR